MELSMTLVNNDVNSLLTDGVLGEVEEVTQLMTQVNSKWQSLQSRATSVESQFQMLEGNYPTFLGEFFEFCSHSF